MDEPLHLPVQMDTLTEILQDRLVEMTNHIDNKERQLIEKLQATEARMQKMERKTLVERQNHRQFIDKTMKRLEDWEENLLHHEQAYARHTSTAQIQLERYTRQYSELQTQTEKAITAWQEIAQTTLKEKIEDQLRKQTEKIDDFATSHGQQLMNLLDGYEEHARGIQAKLLSRLHMETKQKYKEAQSEERQQDAIPMDEDEGPISDGDNASPSVNPAGDNAYPHVRASQDGKMSIARKSWQATIQPLLAACHYQMIHPRMKTGCRQCYRTVRTLPPRMCWPPLPSTQRRITINWHAFVLQTPQTNL